MLIYTDDEFIEGNPVKLNCNHTIFDENKIEKILWFFEFEPIQYDLLNVQLINKNKSIIIEKLNHLIHDGIYYCSIYLKSGIELYFSDILIKTECKFLSVKCKYLKLIKLSLLFKMNKNYKQKN